MIDLTSDADARLEFIERLVVLERLMAEEIERGLPNDYLRGRVEGKRDAYRRVLEMITGEEPIKNPPEDSPKRA